MPKNGQFWYGKGGFAYKKTGAGGVRKNQPIGLITGVPADVNTKFVYGSGVGALTTSVRRAQLKYATVCDPERPCGPFLSKLGIHPRGNNQFVMF